MAIQVIDDGGGKDMIKVVVGIIAKNIDAMTKYLMVASTKNFGEFTGFYYPAGGHSENNETEEETLVREYREEMEINVKPIRRLTKTVSDIKGEETYWWICETDDELKFNKNLEAQIGDIRWMSKKEIKALPKIWPATRKVFEEFVFSEN